MQTTITSIGLSLRKQCKKGRDCSFLHVFKNPFGKYSVHETLWLSRGNKQNTNVDETKNPDRYPTSNQSRLVNSIVILLFLFLLKAGTMKQRKHKETGVGLKVPIENRLAEI